MTIISDLNSSREPTVVDPGQSSKLAPIALWPWGEYLPAGAKKMSSYGTHPLTDTEKSFRYSRPLDIVPYFAARCCPQPRWLPVVALPKRSSGCGEVDGEWWRSLCRRFDGFGSFFFCETTSGGVFDVHLSSIWFRKLIMWAIITRFCNIEVWPLQLRFNPASTFAYQWLVRVEAQKRQER